MIKPVPYSPAEEMANAISHGIGALLSIVALVLLLITSIQQADPTRIVSFSIYGASLFLLFSASTLYHSLTDIKIKKRFKLFDHCAIYLLIAGTYTPLMLITIQGTIGYSMLSLIWALALAGIAFKVFSKQEHKVLSLSLYLGMGFISLAIINHLYQKLAPGGLLLLALGGLFYSSGTIFYLNKRIAFNHAIWHLFVLAGASCHFFMMRGYISPIN